MRVRIGNHEYADTLSRIDANTIRDAVQTGSGTPRPGAGGAIPYHPPFPVAMEINQIGGGKARHIVRPIDLSPVGLGCLVVPFFHEDIRGVVHLALPDGEYQTVEVRIASCQYVATRVHMLNLAFAQAIDLDLFQNTPKEPAPPPVDEAVRKAVAFIDTTEELLTSYASEDLMCILQSVHEEKAGGSPMLLAEEIRSLDRVAVITPEGEILAVNPAWVHFSISGGHGGGAFVGSNYYTPLIACRESCGTINKLLEGLQSVQEGKNDEFRYLYECHDAGAAEEDWYTVRHARGTRGGRECIVVRHTAIERPTAP